MREGFPSQAAKVWRPRHRSDIRFVRPCILLVCIAAGEEPPELGLDDAPARILRVRHPIPACTRARVNRPLVVIVGETVQEDISPLVATCRRIGAHLLHLGPLVPREVLSGWLSRAMELSLARRAAGGRGA